jgi:hypothetical protein
MYSNGSPAPPGSLVVVDEISGFRVTLHILHTQIIKKKKEIRSIQF